MFGPDTNCTLPSPLQGRVGMPAVWATIDEAILSPRAHIAWLGGPGKKSILIEWTDDVKGQRDRQRKKLLLPMKAMPFLWSSSGSLGFSEAWPHPAHTACKNRENDNEYSINDTSVNYCGKTIDIVSVRSYLNRYAFSNVQNELDIGVVVVISSSRHRHVMICHFDVLWERQNHRKPLCFSPCCWSHIYKIPHWVPVHCLVN